MTMDRFILIAIRGTRKPSRRQQRAEAAGHEARADALGLVDQALAREPRLEFRRRAALQEIAHGERVVERRALIAEHDVVGAGHAHHEVDAGGGEQGQQRVHVVLVGLGVLAVASAAADRTHFLMRPDLGRCLAGDAEARLAAHAGSGHDVAIAIGDGLSARAVEMHARPLLDAALPRLAGWRIAPLVVARQGRVAIGDEIARALCADIAVVLIGERPGLSAPDSMGAYLTFKPTPHTTDADRNCISNIRPEGLAYADAAVTLTHLLRAMRARQISGVQLKDDRLLLDDG